jgi:hypothetical protein
VVRNTHRRITAPKAVAIAIGVCLAVGLAVAAPVRAASPTTAAERIVAARTHKKPSDRHGAHHTVQRHAEKYHRTH